MRRFSKFAVFIFCAAIALTMALPLRSTLAYEEGGLIYDDDGNVTGIVDGATSVSYGGNVGDILGVLSSGGSLQSVNGLPYYAEGNTIVAVWNGVSALTVPSGMTLADGAAGGGTTITYADGGEITDSEDQGGDDDGDDDDGDDDDDDDDNGGGSGSSEGSDDYGETDDTDGGAYYGGKGGGGGSYTGGSSGGGGGHVHDATPKTGIEDIDPKYIFCAALMLAGAGILMFAVYRRYAILDPVIESYDDELD